MSPEHTIDPVESLGIISDAILRTRENIKQNGYPFLLWGWLVASASFLFFILEKFTLFEYYFLPFPIFAAIGVVATIVFYKKRLMPTTQTYLQYFLSRLWMILGLSFFLTVFVTHKPSNMPDGFLLPDT